MPEFCGATSANRHAGRSKFRSNFIAIAALGVVAGAGPSLAEVKVRTIDEPVYTFSFAGNYLAARQARKAKDIERAAAFYQRALNADPNNKDLLNRAFILLAANGQIKDATKLANRILVDEPNNSLARLTVIVDAFHDRNFEMARKFIDDRPGRRLDRLTHGILRAWLAFESGNREKAANQFANMRGEKWITSNAAYHGGLLKVITGEYEAAAALLKKARADDPHVMRILMAYVGTLARLGKFDEAADAIIDFKRRSGTHVMIEALQKQIAEKKTPDLVVDSAAAGAAEVLYHIGSAISRDGEEVAAVYLQLSQHLYSGSVLPKVVLAGLFEKFRMHSRSIDELSQIPESSPLHISAQIQIGLHYNSLKNLKASREALAKIVDADPANLLAVRIYATVLRNHKLFDDAAKVLERGIATIKKPVRAHWMLYYHRGICYERTKRWDKAEVDFKQALELYPDQPHVLNYLGYSWIDKGLHLHKALEMIKLAVAQRKDDGYIVDSLGWAYYRLRNYEEAVKHLERAVELRPEDPVINDHLGDAYWRVGRKLEAKFQWTHARDLKPEPEVLEIVLRKLANGMEEEKASAPETPKPGQPKKDG